MDHSKITALLKDTLHHVLSYLDERSLSLLLLIAMICTIHFVKTYFFTKLKLDGTNLRWQLATDILGKFDGSLQDLSGESFIFSSLHALYS